MSRALQARIRALEASGTRNAALEPVTVQVEVVDGRKPFQVYAGERLKPSAWLNHLLIPMLGKRPAGEPLPYCLEREPV